MKSPLLIVFLLNLFLVSVAQARNITPKPRPFNTCHGPGQWTSSEGQRPKSAVFAIDDEAGLVRLSYGDEFVAVYEIVGDFYFEEYRENEALIEAAKIEGSTPLGDDNDYALIIWLPLTAQSGLNTATMHLGPDKYDLVYEHFDMKCQAAE